MSPDFWWGALAGVITVLAIEVVGTFAILLFLRGAVEMDGRTYTLDEDDTDEELRTILEDHDHGGSDTA